MLQNACALVDEQIKWVRQQILAEQNAVHCPFHVKPTKLKWTGGIFEWVELVYAFDTVGCINNGKISLKELFATMGNMFDIEVKEFSNYFAGIKKRKDKKRTEFLSKLATGLLGRMQVSDEKPSRK
jgi:hypothetical protein